MSLPTSAVRRIGQRLLDHEMEHDGNAAEPECAVLASAAARATERLSKPLGRLIGAEGYWGLLRRAVHVAKSESPLLHELQVAPAGALDGLHAAVRLEDPASARQALTAVLVHLVWLLVTFIGEDLTRRTLHDTWPDLQLDAEPFIPAKEEHR